MKIESKLPDAGVTIFTVMTSLSNTHGAINLSQGFPDIATYPELVALVEAAMEAGHNQYAPMQGLPILRERIAEKVLSLYGGSYDPETEITITHGATEALFSAITAVVHRGDEVILFEPAYDSYVPAIRLSGGTPVYLQLKHPDYGIDWDEVRDAVTEKTKLIILNSPHNPTGSVLSGDDIDALRQIVDDTGIMLLGDEVYEHIIFDGLRHESLARYKDLAQRSFVISSFGKTYHTTGWKVGYCLAPEPMMKEFQKVHQFVTFAINTPVQHAYAEFIKQKEAYLTLSDFYQAKRDTFLSFMKDSRFKVVPCRGTYFQLLDYSEISDEPDVEFSKRLTIENGVASIPPSVFYHKGNDYKVLRFCFAKMDETLREAAAKLCEI
jgi:methionine aminotransferase